MSGFVRAAEIVKAQARELADLQTRRARGERVFTGVPTGFRELDADLGGLPSTLVVLAAGTGVGKSSFARAFAWGAIQSGLGDVLLGNFEDGNKALSRRILGEKTGAGASRLRKLDFGTEMHERMFLAADDPLLEHLFITEDLYDVDDFARSVIEHNKRRRVALVIGDYLQIMRKKGIQQNNDRVSNVADTLGKLAKFIDAPVLALSQLTEKKVVERGMETFRKAKQAGATGDELYDGFAPMRGDFHWASEIDQFAKLLLGVHRPGPYKRQMENKPDRDTQAEIRVIKANDNECQRYVVGWNGPLTMAYDLA